MPTWRPDVVAKRCWWGFLMRRHPLERDVLLDETGANTKMARLYGWAPKSEHVVSSVPH
ncbi:MAG: hypothetical protein NTZ32_21195 [Planctomycetales bacterium]|nr:hypothetical protein [Planctomycetales bacterium]